MNCSQNKKLISLLSFLSFLTSCNKDIPLSLHVSYYGKSVSETAVVMKEGNFQGEKIDFVISSYPVIQNVIDSGADIEVYQSLKDEFSKRFNTEGFPQAGIFVKSDIDSSLASDFIADIKYSLNDLSKNSGQKTVEYLNSSYTADEQKNRLGFSASTLEKCQKENSLAFIEFNQVKKDKLISDFALFDVHIDENIFSSNYSKEVEIKQNKNLDYKVTVPSGAPSAIFATHLNSENLNITSPDNVKNSFVKKDSDIVIFDAVNGYNLSKANNYSYKLLSMVTYGNLFLVKNRKSENYSLDENKKIFSFGEGLIPDLVFKKLYANN